MLMLGNLLKENGRTERIAKAAQNELMNIITIFFGIKPVFDIAYSTLYNPNISGKIKIIDMDKFK